MTSKKHSALFEKGMEVRRAVLGDDYVDSALANMDDFTAPLQELVTEYCWGSVWTRDQLDRRTRSLLNIAMLSALNRPHEIEIHLRGALNNGCTPEEIREVILQVAIYCGVPAAIDTMKIARRILTEEKKEVTTPYAPE